MGDQHGQLAAVSAIRGDVLSFVDDPFQRDPSECLSFTPDAIVVMDEGSIVAVGPASRIAPRLPHGVEVRSFENAVIMAGFIDCHVHYPQTPIIGAYGRQLMDWLNEYTFVAEQAFADEQHCRDVADVFLQQCLRAGTTTSAVYCTVHPQSVEAFFEASQRLGMRNIAGKVLMDRNAPAALRDTPQRAYDESAALIARWHGKGRQLYAVTPRFAPTSSPEQLELAGALWHEHPGTYLQSHLSENRAELAWVAELFPERAGYLDVYEHYRMLGPRAIYGHGIHLDENDLVRCHETGTAIAHCPTSNLFLGSGLFDLASAAEPRRPLRVGLATDLGAGTSFSMLQTMNEAYKVAQLKGFSLSALQAFYLATRGSARALDLEDKIGSVAPGREADLVVLDLHSTPLLEYRMSCCESLEERLFVLLTLGDDRATRATYVNGELAYERESLSAAGEDRSAHRHTAPDGMDLQEGRLKSVAAPGHDGLPLGQASRYPSRYTPSLLVAIPRAEGRTALGLEGELPFDGVDIWNAHELSWLQPSGKPVVAVAELRIPARSPRLVESKSLKLYLNSLNQERFSSAVEVSERIRDDLQQLLGCDIEVRLRLGPEDGPSPRGTPEGICIDDTEVTIDTYDVTPELLSGTGDGSLPSASSGAGAGKDASAAAAGPGSGGIVHGPGAVEETLYSQLLKSNCPVTGQPDWATVTVHYRGPPIDHGELLRYIVSYRDHDEFHEQCVERIFMDISRRCHPSTLTVQARYTRRGGLDINPLRSNCGEQGDNGPLWRQ